MNERVVRYMLRLATAGMVFVAVSGPAPAAAQSVEIWPWQNIQQVVNGWPAGTTFYLKAGVHRMQTITPRSGDRFIGEPGTVLSGARQLTSFGRSGAYWFASGQTQQGPRPGAKCDPGYPRCGYPEDLYFDGQPLRHVDNLGAVGPGTFFFDYNADRIYFYDDPTNRAGRSQRDGTGLHRLGNRRAHFRADYREVRRAGWFGSDAGRNPLDAPILGGQAEPLRRRGNGR